jgi:alkylhydroperoxidase/carboxymuconolactone decarboxylase family protein YurZ
MMLDEGLFERGVTLMGKVLGEDTAEATRARHDAAVAAGNAERNDYSTQVAWGFMLHRPQLALRDRALVMLTSDIVQGTPLALRDHVRLALYAGVTRDEINEVVFQLSQYCGFPRTREAGVIIRDLFADLDAGRPIDRKSK